MRQEDKPKKKIKKNKTILSGSFKDDLFEDREIINISDNDLGRYLSMHLKAIRNDNSNKGVRANYRAILRELRRRDK